ncbi:uncharacterized protein BO80DRAFT_287798 [Aspergillus ibericus CBS 121593]|uniref:Uncharacterized protein n=1 Tax=Aspergillus ibericus CBS 121593 TaxID=1448316 RepID=A0A395H7V6_9EURO|nr:hypothetical protein BO80DRAFT_287798 [Aspergillus ibericus CBS 121593]RAL03593.1 hypothetical protein BO80DRAFT_287798 [Aspergillus ibericus CBS 121593]
MHHSTVGKPRRQRSVMSPNREASIVEPRRLAPAFSVVQLWSDLQTKPIYGPSPRFSCSTTNIDLFFFLQSTHLETVRVLEGQERAQTKYDDPNARQRLGEEKEKAIAIRPQALENKSAPDSACQERPMRKRKQGGSELTVSGAAVEPTTERVRLVLFAKMAGRRWMADREGRSAPVVSHSLMPAALPASADPVARGR